MKNVLRSIVAVLVLGLVLPAAYAQTKVDVKATPVKVVAKAEAKAPEALVIAQPVVAVKTSPVVATEVPVAPVVAQPVVVDMPWWKVILRYGLELIFSILGLMATVLVTVLMKKYGFETYAAKVNDLLDRGTGYAEQLSLKALKLNGKPLGSAEKLELALQFVSEQAKQYKLPDKGKEWWTKKIEGWLGAQSTFTAIPTTNTPTTPA